MSSTNRGQSNPTANSRSAAFELVVEAFEASWHSDVFPDIRPFIEVLMADRCRSELLHELVRVDLEYRWKTAAADDDKSKAPRRQLLEDYVRIFPELAPIEKLPLDLIVEEYRVRRRWGDRPNAAGYLERFPGRDTEIVAALAEVDREVERETDPAPMVPEGKSVSSGHTCQSADVPQYDYRDFVLEAHLGSGGIGKVYRAWWKSAKKYVAVKMLRKRWWRQPGADELFFREAAILVHLRHSNIVTLHGIGRTPHGACFLVIELIDGGDLANLVAQELPLGRVIEWIAQAADALAFAHRGGIIHRDVKPSNLLLDRSGSVRVADFGLALTPVFGRDFTDGLIGTVSYMAPEQLFQTGEPPNPASDIFALGAVLFTLLTGQPPYEGGSLSDVVKRRLECPLIPPLRAFRSDLPASLEGIVSRCLAIEPGERFTSAEELASALRHEVFLDESVEKR